VNTLELLLQQFRESDFQIEDSRALLCPMLDARRMEVYCLVGDTAGKIMTPVQAKVIDEGSFAEVLNERLVYFFGDGAEKCKSVIRHPNARFVEGIKPSAAVLGEMGFDKFSQGEEEDRDMFEPFYLKDFLIKKP
jgi:tRNA threonylcarbamoyladenosine biosynthesis protein TsaB